MTPGRRPIEFRHVCAIARMVLLKAPVMTDAEWKESIKQACAKQGWDNPQTALLSRAMSAVEKALSQTMGPRPVHQDTASAPASKPDRCWTTADYEAFARTLKAVFARSAPQATPRRPANVATFIRETLDVSEAAALDQFYIEAQDDRMGALRRFAEIAIVRPADWDFDAIRWEADAHARIVEWERCYSCRRQKRDYHRHHIIQVQHGGSNYVRNIVVICDECHAKVHPWLYAPTPEKSGWYSLATVAPKVIAQVMGRKKFGEAS